MKYKSEKAKSDRSKCKKCKKSINKGEMRVHVTDD